MSEGRRSQVVLLDERRLDIVIQSRLYAGELLDIVSSHFNLKEKEYFGISFVDESGQHSWLQLDKRVLEHDFPKKSSSQGATLTLYFRIKYFVESITQLRDSATIEAFYLQTKSLIAKGELEIDSEIIFQLAALVIQATYGDFTDDQTFKTHLKRLPVLPASTLKEYPSISACEVQVLDYYKVLAGQTRGAAIVNYLSIVESLPTYGQHYYEVKDKAGNPCWLSLSYRGISQYDKNDRRTPRRVFLWKQLENLYFRDRKFTVEVHEARRVVHTLSSFNLYEDAIEEPVEEFDDLSNAICDPTTQVSVSRRALAPSSVTVYVWYAASPNIAKCIWSMAIAQHQFFLDRNHKKSVGRVVRSLSQIASELSRSVQSLSSASSQSNISRSNSSASLPTIVVEGELSEESKAATIEMLAALQSRKDALQDALKKKTEELKVLCLKEGEITGELPPETPFQPGEAQPQVRRRVGTSFTISDKVFYKAKGQDRETLNELELEYETLSKIASAAFKLANDHTARKSVRKVRKVSYVQATSKLKDIEEKLSTLKREKESQKKEQKGESSLKDKGLNQLGLPISSSENSIADRSNSTLNISSVPPSTSLPQLTEGSCSSAPPSPAKCRQRHQSLQHVPAIADNVYEDVIPYDVHTRRNSSSYSAASEYDAISCGSSSLASLGIPYRNRFEVNLDIEGTNHYSVPNRRASQVFNDSDALLDNKSQDAVSHCCVDGNETGRYLNTPLSCSYDDRLSYSKPGGYSSPLKDSIYDKTSIDSNGLDNLSCGGDSAYLPMTYGTNGNDTFNHSYSENSLHRSRSGSLHHKLSQMHISEPHLNLDSADTVDGIRHVYSVPTLKNSLRPINNGIVASPSISDYCSGVSNQTINQVADLVQASVLLQDCKRAASSSSLEFSAPKTKTKEWIETSLDSPVLTRKRKPKVVETPPKAEPAQPAHWLDNGLPPVPNHSDSFYAFPHQQSYYEDRKFAQSGSDLRKSPSPLLAQGNLPGGSSEYRSASTKCLFPSSQRQCESPLSTSSRSLFSDGNQYHHYENIAELSSSSANVQQIESPSFYEQMHAPSDFSLSVIKKAHETSTQARHSGHDFGDRMTPIGHSIAQPQEPPKRPVRRINVGDCYIPESMLEVDTCGFSDSPSEIYEPVNFQDVPLRRAYSQTHCDIPERPHQYPHSYHPESLPPESDNDPPASQNWQHFSPNSVGRENASVSPVPSTMNFSPSVEVNVVSVGHFQPYWEETKPYEISDFYKYSTKHRRQHKPLRDMNEGHSQQTVEDHSSVNSCQFFNHSVEAGNTGGHDCNNPGNVTNHQHQELVTSNIPAFNSKEFTDSSVKYYENSPTPVLRHADDPDKSLSLGEMELRISLADTFHDEMVTWYQNQDSVKKATLV